MAAFALPQAAHATLTCPKLPTGVSANDIADSWIRLQVGIPGITVTCTDSSDGQTKDYVKDMGQYIGGLYKYFVGVIGIIAALMVFYGGLRWLTAAGNASRVKDAKETIFSALIAIVIAFGSYTLLYTINKKLVDVNPPVLKVADTFLVSFDGSCPTSKICLSGTNIGKNCNDIGDCPGAGSGGCELPIEEVSGAPVTTATCGVRYNYRTIQGLKNTSKTCIGKGCANGNTCAKGTLGIGFDLTAYSPLNPSITKLKFVPDQQGTDYVCAAPKEICRGVKWKDTSGAMCASYSVPSVGMCRYFDADWYDVLYRDSCYFSPVLTCPDATWTRVACTPGCQSNCGSTFSGSTFICTASTAVTVYEWDKVSGAKDTYQSICCQKGTEFKCVSRAS